MEMETGKMINRISNRLRRRSRKVQETVGISGARGNILDYILVESEKHNVYQKEIEKALENGDTEKALELIRKMIDRTQKGIEDN